MCMLPPLEDAARQREMFHAVRELRDSLERDGDGLRLDTLSMGMSGDFEAAIAAGSTMVRIGTAIFGPRPQRSAPVDSGA